MKFLVLATAAAFCATQISARPTYVALIPGASNVKGVAAIGHIDPEGGGPRNPFGLDFAKAETTWNVDLCYKDSDSDGQYNGAELGDPCCEWTKSSDKLAYTTATAPGDAKSKQDPTIWASVKCADGTSPDAKYKAFMAKAGGGNATAPVGSGSKAKDTPAVGDKPATAPASSSKAPASATPAPTTTKSGASQVVVAASAVTIAVAALMA